MNRENVAVCEVCKKRLVIISCDFCKKKICTPCGKTIYLTRGDYESYLFNSRIASVTIETHELPVMCKECRSSLSEDLKILKEMSNADKGNVIFNILQEIREKVHNLVVAKKI